MNAPPLWLAVAAGGAIGALCRHAVGTASLRLLGAGFPWGTLAVNVAGSIAMGLAVAWLLTREPQAGAMRAFIVTGLLGGFTTFSAFAFEAVTLWRDKSPGLAAVYVGLSVALSMFGLLAGLSAGKSFT